MKGNCGKGKQAVHEPKSGPEVSEDAGGCEFGSALRQFGSVLYRLYRKGKQAVHEPEPELDEDGGVCEFWSVLWPDYMCGMGKQAVHELEPEVSRDRGVCVCVNLGQL